MLTLVELLILNLEEELPESCAPSSPSHEVIG